MPRKRTRRRERFEPLSLAVNKQAAWLALHRKDYDRPIALYRGVLDLDPYFPQAQREIGIAFYRRRGIPKPSKRCWPRGNFPRTTSPGRTLRTLRAYAASGNTREAKRILTEMEHASGYVDPHDLALVNAGLGDKKRAFEWLEKSVRGAFLLARVAWD